MRIDKILLRQVGPFVDAAIELPPGKDPGLADVYLLTGPNGSGKSTALYAVAGILSCGQPNLGKEISAPRFRSAEAIAAINCDNLHLISAWNKVRGERRVKIMDPFSDDSAPLFARSPKLGFFKNSVDHPKVNYWQNASQFTLDAPRDAFPRFDWAAFAYAGMRQVSDVRLTAIQEPTYSPFENSLSFINTANTQRLAEWVANQDFKRLKAREAGKSERAVQLANSVAQIEAIVAEIVGESFAFDTNDEDNNVRARINGSVVDLGLLPDGLKSIVSWVADLLMRLDRIPWVDDTPPLERNFLLLLDEVDIHLHPAWQRKVLPIVQKMFPNAQIIASTHSPFVVASADDAHIISLKLERGVASVEEVAPSNIGVSYSAVLRSIFGIDSEFDIETEDAFRRFREEINVLLRGEAADRSKVDELADWLAHRSEEVKELVAIELRQLDRQLKTEAAR